jgi:hypothetical protein
MYRHFVHIREFFMFTLVPAKKNRDSSPNLNPLIFFAELQSVFIGNGDRILKLFRWLKIQISDPPITPTNQSIYPESRAHNHVTNSNRIRGS